MCVRVADGAVASAVGKIQARLAVRRRLRALFVLAVTGIILVSAASLFNSDTALTIK